MQNHVLNNRDRLAALVIFFGAVGFMFYAQTLPSAAKMFPEMILAGVLVCSVLMFLSTYRRAARETDGEAKPFLVNPRNLAVALTAFAGYISMVFFAGYFTATAIILVGLPYVLGYRGLRTILLSMSVFMGLIFVIFVMIFERPLPLEFFQRLEWFGG
jgi:putative tricarboxylic transport membrane protein